VQVLDFDSTPNFKLQISSTVGFYVSVLFCCAILGGVRFLKILIYAATIAPFGSGVSVFYGSSGGSYGDGSNDYAE
jgi:hypothetical protein